MGQGFWGLRLVVCWPVVCGPSLHVARSLTVHIRYCPAPMWWMTTLLDQQMREIGSMIGAKQRTRMNAPPALEAASSSGHHPPFSRGRLVIGCSQTPIPFPESHTPGSLRSIKIDWQRETRWMKMPKNIKKQTIAIMHNAVRTLGSR